VVPAGAMFRLTVDPMLNRMMAELGSVLPRLTIIAAGRATETVPQFAGRRMSARSVPTTVVPVKPASCTALL
jgi:hypothetical protein